MCIGLPLPDNVFLPVLRSCRAFFTESDLLFCSGFYVLKTAQNRYFSEFIFRFNEKNKNFLKKKLPVFFLQGMQLNFHKYSLQNYRYIFHYY